MSSIAKVKEYLARFGAAGRVMELDHSSATVELAAQALGVEGARIAKSLSFHMGEGCMIIVMAGDVKVDNARFKATFGFKAKMLTADEALAMTYIGFIVSRAALLRRTLPPRLIFGRRKEDFSCLKFP